MPVWRCPHCGTPQAESSRCWVCRKSTTTCATCLHFRRGIASGLGLCGLDPRHSALDGSEIRACWTAAQPQPLGTDDGLPGEAGRRVPAEADTDRQPPRTFVPVDELVRSPGSLTPAASAPVDASPGTGELVPAGAVPATGPNGWSLWGDPDR